MYGKRIKIVGLANRQML